MGGLNQRILSSLSSYRNIPVEDSFFTCTFRILHTVLPNLLPLLIGLGFVFLLQPLHEAAAMNKANRSFTLTRTNELVLCRGLTLQAYPALFYLS